MKNASIAIGLILFGILAGWTLGGMRPGARDKAAVGLTPPASGRAQQAPALEKPAPKPAFRWAVPAVDVNELEGLHLLGGRSPVPDMALWLGPEPSDPGFEALAEWLDFGAGQKEALARILLESAQSLSQWEKSAIAVEETAPHHFTIHWKSPPPAHLSDLQQALHDSFGESLARSLWLRGDLERFGRIDPRLVPNGEATLQAVLSPGASAGILKLTLNRGSDFVQVFRAPGKADDALNPSFAMAYRLAHLIDLEQAAREMVPEAGSDHPFATASGSPGMVVSPISGKIIDVTGIPAGSLVRDPTVPEGGFFRVPPDAVEE
jgi:hypothetical protein